MIITTLCVVDDADDQRAATDILNDVMSRALADGGYPIVEWEVRVPTQVEVSDHQFANKPQG
jgi:hypothetical protein